MALTRSVVGVRVQMIYLVRTCTCAFLVADVCGITCIKSRTVNVRVSKRFVYCSAYIVMHIRVASLDGYRGMYGLKTYGTCACGRFVVW
jgi:hypothetical protein